MTKRKQSLKQPISFKENVRDLTIYNYLLEIKYTLGISTYVKILIEKDMKEKGLWKYD
ncbi:MAG: hypothetical protein KIB00_09945 [Paeniclostridium sordellii]|nr:hypothetical protein [Paeniclostridium sordellii]